MSVLCGDIGEAGNGKDASEKAQARAVETVGTESRKENDEMTITIQIGNSDDKLTQKEWAAFVQSTQNYVERFAKQTHFFGAPVNYAQWQNAAWVFECIPENVPLLKGYLLAMREHWQQDSIAWTEGKTEFI